ncbi:hypothetical protein GIB67_023480, partial [Kingdonia uniflora]
MSLDSTIPDEGTEGIITTIKVIVMLITCVHHKLSDKLLTFEQQKEKRDLANAKRRQAYANKQREKQKQVSSNQMLSTQQCRKRKVDVAISDLCDSPSDIIGPLFMQIDGKDDEKIGESD